MRRCLKSRHIIIRMRLLHADVCSDAIIILIQYFSRMRPLQAVGHAPREIYIYDRSMTADMEVRQYMSKEDEIFKSVFSYIGDNLTEKLTVEEIAKHVYLSPTYLQSVFKENYGVPLAEYVRRQKLKKARELLYNTQKRISDIAYDCGFEHESSFIRSFKREFGMTPGEARRRALQEQCSLRTNRNGFCERTTHDT